MPIATAIAGIVGAATAIGSSVASGVQEGGQANEAKALMELNHKYQTLAEKRKMARQKAADRIASEQYNISKADKKINTRDNDIARNYSKGMNAQQRMMQTLNNSPALREQTIKIFGRGV